MLVTSIKQTFNVTNNDDMFFSIARKFDVSS